MLNQKISNEMSKMHTYSWHNLGEPGWKPRPEEAASVLYQLNQMEILKELRKRFGEGEEVIFALPEGDSEHRIISANVPVRSPWGRGMQWLYRGDGVIPPGLHVYKLSKIDLPFGSHQEQVDSIDVKEGVVVVLEDVLHNTGLQRPPKLLAGGVLRDNIGFRFDGGSVLTPIKLKTKLKKYVEVPAARCLEDINLDYEACKMVPSVLEELEIELRELALAGDDAPLLLWSKVSARISLLKSTGEAL